MSGFNRKTDYIIVNPTVSTGKFTVVVMKLNAHDEYEVGKTSAPMPHLAAGIMAAQWSVQLNLPLRDRASWGGQ